MSKVPKRPEVQAPSAAEDKVITAAARSDPDAQALTLKQLKQWSPCDRYVAATNLIVSSSSFQDATAPRSLSASTDDRTYVYQNQRVFWSVMTFILQMLAM
jgi:hypothetical protein